MMDRSDTVSTASFAADPAQVIAVEKIGFAIFA
jgi:hypothetical protein